MFQAITFSDYSTTVRSLTTNSVISQIYLSNFVYKLALSNCFIKIMNKIREEARFGSLFRFHSAISTFSLNLLE